MENFMNKLTDMDWGWWPFLFLRPSKTEFMTSKIVVKMSLYYGFTYGIIIYILSIPSISTFNIIEAFILLLIISISFFIIYRFTFAYFWNRRVDKIK